MVTDISPILGMPLVSAIEAGSLFIGIAIAVSIAFNVAIARWQQSKYNKEQERQTKVASAQLSLKLLERWDYKTNPEFAKFTTNIEKRKVKDDDLIARYLDALEEVSIFWRDGTITFNHVKELFTPEFKVIDGNEPALRVLKKEREIDKNAYKNLCELLTKLEISY